MVAAVGELPVKYETDADNERRDERRRQVAEDAAALGLTHNPCQEPAPAGQPPYWLR